MDGCPADSKKNELCSKASVLPFYWWLEARIPIVNDAKIFPIWPTIISRLSATESLLSLWQSYMAGENHGRHRPADR